MQRRFVRKPDSPDPRDRRFVPSQVPLLAAPPPQTTDLRKRIPAPWDQGEEGSCGPHSASALMCLLNGVSVPYSRQQIYYSVRLLEGDVGEDGGVETRDLFKILQKVGAAPESMWPYLPANLFKAPPAPVLAEAAKHRISSYSRILGEDDMIACLAEGFPFVLGFNVFSSFESDQLARTGVMPMPNVRREQYLGGHDVLAVGYDLKFRSSSTFKNSRVDSTLVSDHALLIRNSWGIKWGIQGHLWMPMSYAVNPSTGGDCWTGRL